MTSILQEILLYKKTDLIKKRALVSLDQIRQKISSRPPARDFYKSLLQKSPNSIIGECKRQSPSKGLLIQNYNARSLAKSYEAGGAAAISVLTDERYFGGDLRDLDDVSRQVKVPVLRKDFIIDDYQIFEARAWGADSFLLIAGTLDLEALNQFIECGRSLGMEPLVESHTEEELQTALASKAKIIGINNRSLENFSVSLETASTHLSNALKSVDSANAPSVRLFVCESGIHNRKDIDLMQKQGFGAFLIGEALVTSENPTHKMKELSGLLS